MTRPRAKPCGSSGDSVGDRLAGAGRDEPQPLGLLLRRHHAAREDRAHPRSTSRALEIAPPAACAQEVLSPRTSRPISGWFQVTAQSGGWYSAQAVFSK